MRSIIGRCYVCPATLLPYSETSELRLVALRPALSSGLPFSSNSLKTKNRTYEFSKLDAKIRLFLIFP